MTQYQIQVWSSDAQRWIDAPAPLSDYMTQAIIRAEMWFPTERIQVVAVRVH
jgi:hypothetical protein